MYHAAIVFLATDGSRALEHECTIPSLPQKGDLMGFQGVKNKPYKCAVGKVQDVLRIIYPTEATVFQNRALITVTLLMTSQEAFIDVSAIAL